MEYRTAFDLDLRDAVGVESSPLWPRRNKFICVAEHGEPFTDFLGAIGNARLENYVPKFRTTPGHCLPSPLRWRLGAPRRLGHILRPWDRHFFEFGVGVS